MNRRNFVSMLTGALVAPALFMPKRTFFLPPVGGWPHPALGYTVRYAEIADNLYKLPLARLVIPAAHAHFWDEEIAAGRVTYDLQTETMTLWAHPPIEHRAKNPTWEIQPWDLDEDGRLTYKGDIQARELKEQIEWYRKKEVGYFDQWCKDRLSADA